MFDPCTMGGGIVMITDKNSLTRLGQVLWVILLVLGLASIMLDWLILKKLTPLGISILIVFAISLIAWFFGIPIVTTKGARQRLIFIIGFLLGVLGLLLSVIAFRLFG